MGLRPQVRETPVTDLLVACCATYEPESSRVFIIHYARAADRVARSIGMRLVRFCLVTWGFSVRTPESQGSRAVLQ
jgi:hypothetical protein